MTPLRSLQRDLALALTQSAPPVADVSAQELARSRETLIRKRMAQTRHAMPLAAELLGPEFLSFFRSYSQDHHFDGPFAWAHDVVAFAHWIHKQKVAPKWTGDVARWESVSARWFLARYSLQFMRFEYDIRSWIGSRMVEPHKRTNVWVRIRCGSWAWYGRVG